MMNKIKDVLDEYEIVDLMDYTASSNIGMGLDEFYRDVLRDITNKDINTYVNEISCGKYEVFLQLEDREISFTSKAWNDRDIIEEDLVFVLDKLEA